MDRPQNHSTIHGHPVYCDDEDARFYLRHLDNEEATTIFQHAKEHGESDFEIKAHSDRKDYSMQYDNGAYIVMPKESEHGGWI